jgi:hypothetical protein
VITETKLAEMLQRGNYDVLVGDGLLRAFLPSDSKTAFVEIPHAAVSSRISWNSPIRPFAADFMNVFNHVPACCGQTSVCR